MGAGARPLEDVAGGVRACAAFVLCGFATLREPPSPVSELLFICLRRSPGQVALAITASLFSFKAVA